MTVAVCVLQGDKPSSGFKTGGGDFDHIFEAHWEYCPDLLCFFHCFWNSGSSGQRFLFLSRSFCFLCRLIRIISIINAHLKKYGGIFLCLLVQTLSFLCNSLFFFLL